MQRLGMYIKVFQFGVCTYDLLVLDRTNVVNNLIQGGMLATPEKTAQLAFGLLLLFIGQVLNYAVFEALGAKGVYYGYEFGYPVSRVYCFPYNLSISDPQYWGKYLHVFIAVMTNHLTALNIRFILDSTGVVLSVFGIYIAVGASSLMIPIFELFWYLMSMKVLENERGRRWANAVYGSKTNSAKAA
ncbi:hypothetical protein ACHAWU_009895 [Discostella pseudostelligera]|uniref:phosphatidyl-N-methylethanolamine N-methyltransferase n=1 Tax=Discostella pseudostelligera TaxID=259834 RepID=A0ABD3M341_9STRA